MGCLLAVLVAVLALAVPASIARASLVGAYLVIAVLAAIAAASVVWRARRRAEPGAARFGVLIALTLGYAAVVTALHVLS